jgi:hypothetical protein
MNLCRGPCGMFEKCGLRTCWMSVYFNYFRSIFLKTTPSETHSNMNYWIYKKLSQFLELPLSAKWPTAKLVLALYRRDCFKSRATSLGVTASWVVPSCLARLMKQSRHWGAKTSFAIGQMSHKSHATSLGATASWVTPSRLARLMKLSRQRNSKTSTALHWSVGIWLSLGVFLWVRNSINLCRFLEWVQ